jgi:hypothetical protein
MLPARLARFDTDVEAVGQVAGLDQEAAGADSCGLGFVYFGCILCCSWMIFGLSALLPEVAVHMAVHRDACLFSHFTLQCGWLTQSSNQVLGMPEGHAASAIYSVQSHHGAGSH